MSYSENNDSKEQQIETHYDVGKEDIDLDAEFGGREARRKLEKRFIMKLDMRMSILIFIYILNYVRQFQNILWSTI